MIVLGCTESVISKAIKEECNELDWIPIIPKEFFAVLLEFRRVELDNSDQEENFGIGVFGLFS